MPSQSHEALLLLFRNRPQLAPELLRDVLHIEVPAYSEVRLNTTDLTQLQPAEYRADLVVLLYEGKPVLGIVVEAQLQTDTDKRYSWPVYATGLRARIRCPVCLLVLTFSEPVAKWAAQGIDLGGGNRFTPLVIGPSGVPMVTDEEAARADPELAVLSAMAHGQDADTETAVRIAVVAMAASVGLDRDRATLYFDLVETALSKAARKALRSMDPSKYEYQSEFAKHYFSQGIAQGISEGIARGEAEGEARGRAEGKAEGKAEVVLKLLRRRFGALSADQEAHVHAASLTELDAIAEATLTASSLQEALAL